MEPFYLRCETCHARLKVSDERFLGEVQSCPKCGSMVHILAPASLAAAATLPDATAEAATSTSLTARATTILRENSLVASAGAGALLIAGGVLGYLVLSGGEETTAPPTATLAVVEPAVEHEDVALVEKQPARESQPIETNVAEPPATLPPAIEQKQTEVVAIAERAPVEPVVVATPKPSIQERDLPSQPPRTMMLESVPSKPQTVAVNKPTVEAAEYPPSIEVEAAAIETIAAEPKPLSPEPAAPPARVTNFTDQLAVPIESIDLPAMPIGEFVNLMSSMTAVPIKLDTKVLGDVGMSSRSTVTVRGENTTAGILLARVLKEHRLTCVERDGALVVVKAKR